MFMRRQMERGKLHAVTESVSQANDLARLAHRKPGHPPARPKSWR